MSAEKELEKLLPETDPKAFPTGTGIKVIRGKVLAKTPTWLKAIVLVESQGKKQLRFYGWQKKNEEYKVRQKFNVSHGYSADIAEIMMAFYSMEV